MRKLSYFVYQEKEMSKKETVTAKVVCIAQGVLKRWKSLVVVLKSIDALAAMSASEAEGGYGHHGME